MSRPKNRRVSSRSAFASFAERVSGPVQVALKAAEAEALGGDAVLAQQRLREVAAALEPEADDDRVAIGELAEVIAAWAGSFPEANAFVEILAEQVTSPKARGALYFHRGRSTSDAESSRDLLRKALHEFDLAGDLRGRAVTLAQMCWPNDSSVGAEHRLRVGRQALGMAIELDDPWTIAFCAGRLAATETYLDQPEALDRWRQAAQALPQSADSVTAEIASLNQYNWGLTAFAHGDYALGSQVLQEGSELAHGPGWRRRYDEVAALVAWRMGLFDRARRLAQSSHRSADADWTHIAGIVLAAQDLETSAKLETTLIDETVSQQIFDIQMRWLALVVQAKIRVARREPSPLRDLPQIIDEAATIGMRMGWEDALLVMAEHEPDLALESAERLADLWPSYPRGVMVRDLVEGLLSKAHGYAAIGEAAEAFLTLPEPVTAARAMHAAARVAPTVAEGNALRRRAIELVQDARAERSLSEILRDRALHRGTSHVQIPPSQRQAVTAGLTKREREVAQLAARGLTAQEIADELHVSLATARHHLQRVREKFGGVPKRKLAILLAPGEAHP